jgi:hypothetical protein
MNPIRLAIPTGLILLILCSCGCVSSRITSFTDPNYRDVSFSRLLVIANFKQAEVIKKVESIIVNEFRKRGVYAVENSSLLPPIREYTSDEKRRVFIRERLDSYVIVYPAGMSNSMIDVPTVSTTKVDVSSSRNSARGSARTITSGGGQKEILNSVDTHAQFFDLSNGNIVWKGETITEISYNAYGQTFADVDDVLSSACSEIVDQILKDRIMHPTN